MFLVRYKLCSNEDFEFCGAGSLETLVLAGTVIAGFFVPFVAYLLWVQLRCVVRGTSGIDELQQNFIEKRPAYENLRDTFGGSFGLRWFLPIGIPDKGDNVPIKI